MYLDYFSLDRHPFRITPDPSLFFPGGQNGRGVVLNALIYGITSGEGILKVVGEVGSGKTMLCRMLEEKLPESVEIVYIANPSLTAREILYAIAIELNLEVTAATERLKVMHLLQDYLLARHSQGGSVVVFIEEAQSMPLETLEEIRLLSNLETHRHKLMQIVLFGQPELDSILAQKNIRQLRERITHSFQLDPLTTRATGDYLQYRLKAAGCPRGNLFSPRAVKMIASASSGLTRRINILADKSLLAAYADSPSRQAPLDGDEPLVLPRHVKAAIRDTDYRKRVPGHWLIWGLGTGCLLFAGVITVNRMGLLPGSMPPGAGDNAPVAVVAEGTVARTDDDETRSSETPSRATGASESGGDGPATVAVNAATGEETGAALAADAQVEAGMDIPGEDAAPVRSSPAVPDDSPVTLASLDADSADAVPEAALQHEAGSQALADAAPEAESPGPAVTVEQAPEQEPESTDATFAESSVPATGEAQAAAIHEETPTPASPVDIVPAGLAEIRINPTATWLRELAGKSGYTIQLFSVPSTNPAGLEEYLQFLQLVSLLDDTYICFMPVSSPNSGRWQVMHREFEGVTPARNLIASLPDYLRQYGPYVRNLGGIECSYPVETRD